MEHLNKLMTEQQKLAEELGRKVSNMKKDSRIRKTEKYLEDRATELDNLWQKFLSRHTEIMGLDTNKESTYAKSNFFDQVELAYNQGRTHISDCLESLVETKENKGRELKMMEQARRIELLNADIESAKQATEGFGQYLEDIKKQFAVIVEKDVELSGASKDCRESKYFKENWFQNIRQKYRGVTIFLDKKYRDQSEPGLRAPTNTVQTNVLLPKLKIPIFSGEYDEWPTFQDIFTKVIDSNSNVSKVEKMQFLKTYVKGDAKDAIQHYEITENNYDSAWNELKQRYDNKRRIVNKLINKILQLPIMQIESASQLKTIYNTIKECMEALKMQGIDTTSWDAMIVCVVTNKWDSRTNGLFETSIEDSFKVQSLESVLKFLMKRFQAMEAAHEKSREKDQEYTKKPSVPNYKNCKYCNSSHSIYNCGEFKGMSNNERYKFVKENKLCFNCLNHDFGKKCFSNSKCRVCEKNHHTLIHTDVKPFVKSSSDNNSKQKEKSNPQEKSVRVTNNVAFLDETVLLATALIKVQNASNGYEYLRALIDPGSQAAFATEEAAVLLGLPREKISAEITGLGDIKPKISTQRINILCKGRVTGSYNLQCDLYILPKLTSTTPERQVQFTENDWHNRILADPTFFKPGPVDVILGTREYREIILDGIHKTKDGLLGQNTELGWIVFGASPAFSNSKIKVRSMITRAQEEKDISKFWELEEVATENGTKTKEEQDCERFYETSTIRNADGTYTVNIPFKTGDIELGESRSRAMARLLQLEKRLQKQKDVNNDYKEFMRTYIDLGHMIPVNKPVERTGKYYIPHQCVIRDDSSTTKLRVVFDASCKTSNGKSLNDVMKVGPRIQQELCDILIRWRSKKIAFTADIEKMYRQIKIQEEDQEFQKILWRFTEEEPIKEYRLTTVTYGTACAPYLAVKTIQRLADDEKSRFPEASRVAMENCYVDDVLAGADCVKEAVKLQEDLVALFRTGGFNLRKWCSNSANLLETIPAELREKQIVEFGEAEVKKSLGVHWAPFDDTIRFRVQTSTVDKVTKRTILSNVAKLFDPLGLLSPIVVTAKLIIQELWKENILWDQTVPNHIAIKWNKFYSELKQVEEVVTPRWTQQDSRSEKQELHGFCDASEKAIGAVVYVRTYTDKGNAKITLLVAKSKVAPIKTRTTLPRLELCAAVLLAKLLHRVLKAFSNPEWRVHTWTDSMIALAWITGNSSRWKTFVANRVGEIQTLIGHAQWHHVGTKDNPADVVSRGLNPSKIKSEVLWWEGPNWLKYSDNHWPTQEEIQPTEIDRKVSLRANIVVKREPIHKRFSSLRKTIRVMAYCIRFWSNCKNQHKQTGPLSVDELDEALTRIVKEDQEENWDEEMHSLSRKVPVPKQSKISNLHPFLDKNGVIRVGGRLHHSLLRYTEKHPIIIAANSQLAELVVREAHHQTLHGGNQQTLAYIRRKYWIINGKKLVKKIINKCPTCLRYRAKTAVQLMGQLPESRVTPAPAFTNTGVDYAGPILVRTTKGRGHKSYKGYIAVFVCLTTKAVHLEVVSDMTSEMFMAALKRFTARRGTCANMYSDNGTTFVGTSKMLNKDVTEIIKKSDIQDRLANIGTQWHFIPPSAPHFGGIWEAGVKSMKNHLKRVIGETTLTYEELTTLLHEIEACLNSRPICPLTDEINDVSALTPGHFLVGRELLTPLNPIDLGDTKDLPGRWKIIKKMKKDFWKIWSTEYLHTLQQMNKWKLENENMKRGDVVVIKEDNICPSKWPLARVTEVHEGAEGLVRVVTLKRAEGAEIKRPIHKLIPLPTEPESQAHEKVKKRFQTETGRSPRKTWRAWTIALIFMLNLCRAHAVKSYHIEKPKPGFYVEHLGRARVDQGFFRIELKIDGEKLEVDMTSVSKTIGEISNLCEKMEKLSVDIKCKLLIHRLEEEQKRIAWMKKGIDRMVLKRHKRGLWGTVLTSIFGVNDEVYKQIDELDANQQKLIQTSNHQTKFMLQALSRFNDTETRITKKLNEFNEKLKKGIAAVEDMKQWWGSPDNNKLEIHLLSIFEVEKSYLDELIRYYKSVLNIASSKENLYELISPAHIEKIISEARSKLPTNIEIIPHSIVKTEIVQKDNMTCVFGYFLIAGIAEYDLIKANSVPLKVENGVYWVLDVGNQIMAIDYNGQRYFELSDADLRGCLIVEKQMYICSPSIIRNIANNPNCVIDELYQRTENSSCPVRQNKLQNMIWKKMYTRNTWMFIAEKKTKIAVICNGEREETYVEKTGVIAISQNCIIATQNSILTPQRIETIPVVAGYSRPVAVNLTMSKNSNTGIDRNQEDEIEPYDDLKDLVSAEEDIQSELQGTHWNEIKHHSAWMSGITTVSIIAVLLIIACCFKILGRYWSKCRIQTRRNRTQEEPNEGTEMKPLTRVESNDPLRDFNIPGLIDSNSK